MLCALATITTVITPQLCLGWRVINCMVTRQSVEEFWDDNDILMVAYVILWYLVMAYEHVP